jgi:hypothetical protein
MGRAAPTKTQNREVRRQPLRYLITGTLWPIGQFTIPCGAVIDDVAGTDPYSMLVRASGASPPSNALLLDNVTYDVLYQAQMNPILNNYDPSTVSYTQTGSPLGTSSTLGPRRGAQS